MQMKILQKIAEFLLKKIERDELEFKWASFATLRNVAFTLSEFRKNIDNLTIKEIRLCLEKFVKTGVIKNYSDLEKVVAGGDKKIITHIIDVEIDKDILKEFIQKPAYWINKHGHHIVLNDIRILSRPEFASTNYDVADYILQHPRERITKSSIEAEMKIKVLRQLHKIVSDLGFLPELKRLFFDGISEKGLYFRNYINQSELAQLGIEKQKLAKEIKKLRPFRGR